MLRKISCYLYAIISNHILISSHKIRIILYFVVQSYVPKIVLIEDTGFENKIYSYGINFKNEYCTGWMSQVNFTFIYVQNNKLK